VEKFLLREIKIVSPKVVICLGKETFKGTSKNSHSDRAVRVSFATA
jgi:uracil-DNA glycosylase